MVHLNGGGVGPTPKAVHAALARHLDEAGGYPYYAMRAEQRPQVEGVRRRLAQLLMCDAEELAFTRNTSEGMAICQFGIPLSRGDEVLTTNLDYPRMLRNWHQRAHREGVVVRTVDIASAPWSEAAIVDLFASRITPRTRLLSICHMIDVTGQILPVRALAEMAHSRDVAVLVDGAQTFGQLDFSIADLGCDYFATSLHKWLGGPHGTGLLYVARGRIAETWARTGTTDEGRGDIRKFEDVGTDLWIRLLAISEALSFHQRLGPARKERRLRQVRDRWLDGLAEVGGIRAIRPWGPHQTCALTTVELDGLEPVALRDHLWHDHRIRVRPITRLGLAGIRISAGLHNTNTEIDHFVEVLEHVKRNGLPA